MNRVEHIQRHQVRLTPEYMPNPRAHLQSERDRFHFSWTLRQLALLPGASILDVGCWDGWLGFLLMEEGFRVHGVELIPDLALAARRYAAAIKAKGYHVYQGFFDKLSINGSYDVVTCYEVLEHLPIELAAEYIEKMDALANRHCFVSLPDQRHEDNDQHQWTPSGDLIDELFWHKKNYALEYRDYPGTGIPGNWMIRWDK